MTETKQQIKDRLLRSAAVYWGLNETPSENNFDPLVGLLFGAVSSELEKISGDIEDSRGRILERLVHLLFPEVLTAGIPAHAIAHARPLEGRLTLSAKTPFYTPAVPQSARGQANNAHPDIFFTPAFNVPLTRASVAFLVTPSVAYKVESGNARHFLQSVSGLTGNDRTIWIGIKQAAQLMPSATFYFELRNEAGKKNFYQHLPEAAWDINGTRIDAAPGFADDLEMADAPDPAEIVTGSHNITRQVVQHVSRYYREQFVSLKNIRITAEETLPGFLANATTLAGDGKEKEKEKIVWLRIRFPDTVSPAVLEDLHISLNCFPVINRRMYKLQQRLLQFINILPLQTDAFFLDMDSITDQDGQIIPASLDTQEGLRVSLRYGGAARFSAKDAAAAIDSLIQQVKDESAAYAVIGNDFLTTELTYLQQTLNKLEEQLVHKHLVKGNAPHLVFTGKKDGPPVTVFVNYWCTQGETGNMVKSGTPLFLLQNAELEAGSFQLVTVSTGGRNPLNENQKILAYKAALLSKEKLVTREDIVSFCKVYTGIEQGRFTVETGFMVSDTSRQSFSRTIDVKIELPPDVKNNLLKKGSTAALEKDLSQAITSRSGFFMPVRVFIL